MTWLRTIIYSLVLSFAFFMYFAQFVADSWTLNAIAEVKPRLQEIKESFGSNYARAMGHAIAFFVGFLGTLIFILPLGFVFKEISKYAAVAAIVIFPVVVISITGIEILTPYSIAACLQPIVGAIIAVAIFAPKKKNT